MNEFLVKCTENKKNFWIDLDSGQRFEKCEIPYNMCQHGLCKTLGRKVLKKTIPDNFEPLVFKATEKTNPKLPKKGISFSYMNEDKKKAIWEFTPYAIMEMIKGMNEDMSDKKLCIRLCAPRDVVKKLRYKLIGGLIEKIEKELGGGVNEKERRRKVGNVVNEKRRGRKSGSIAGKRFTHITAIKHISGSR